jgi:DNA repair and recombination protein RAD54B
MGKAVCNDVLLPGSTLSVGGKEIEVDMVISKHDFLAGKAFLNSAPKPNALPTLETHPRVVNPAVSSWKPLKRKPGDNEDEKKKNARTKTEGEMGVTPNSFYGNGNAPQRSLGQQFKTPVKKSTVLPQGKPGVVTPRHDPHAPNALVMKRPKDCPKGKQIVDVVVDPLLSKKLRPHQREGVKFLYECVMGMRDYNGQGALLADDMGLGKTLQTITLIWTLLKQNPIYGSQGVIKKALVVCPVTLIENWQKEFRSWLGKERIGVLVADTKTRLTDFTHGKSYSVMIVGYERIRSIAEELDKGGGIDLVIADEGHRLKTEKNKSAQAIRSLRTERKIVLSGTPLQNDLSEFYVMVDFINPGLLGTASAFKKQFEAPILKSRQPGASEKEKELGEGRQEELTELTQHFILRRNADVQARYLPPKTEIVLFCKPTAAQAEIYEQVLVSPACMSAINGYKSAQALSLINLLRKVCNSPRLLLASKQKAKAKLGDEDDGDELIDSISTSQLSASLLSTSTKMRVLDALLRNLAESTDEKIVLVSNYTATLDLLQTHLVQLGIPSLRLDGDTPTNRRQDLVNEFNKSRVHTYRALLLSAKAGGVGLNLIGASRLVLFDVDWNPATDLQAMARVHRPGQTRPTFIYRLLMAGGMDEKIWQRQLTKTGLADSIVDNKKTASVFTAEELRDLFTLDTTSSCKTHELLGCDCQGRAPRPAESEARGAGADADEDAPIIIESSSAPAPASSDDDEDDEDGLPLNPCDARRRCAAKPQLIPASKYDWRAEEAKIAKEAADRRRKNSAGKLASLMEYEHVDVGVFEGGGQDVFGYVKEEVWVAVGRVGDKLLCAALGEGGGEVRWAFVKRSGGEE